MSLSAADGTISSLVKSLMASATVWKIPKGPSRLGPKRSWKKALIFLSSQIRMIIFTVIIVITIIHFTNSNMLSAQAGFKPSLIIHPVKASARLINKASIYNSLLLSSYCLIHLGYLSIRFPQYRIQCSNIRNDVLENPTATNHGQYHKIDKRRRSYMQSIRFTTPVADYIVAQLPFG
jgi:hypothetical protein